MSNLTLVSCFFTFNKPWKKCLSLAVSKNKLHPHSVHVYDGYRWTTQDLLTMLQSDTGKLHDGDQTADEI